MYVYLEQDSGNNGPHGGHLAMLAKPTSAATFDGPVIGVNKYVVIGTRPVAPAVHLAANTRYWVVIWAGESGELAELETGVGGSETGAAGWTIANEVLVKPHGQAYTSWSSLPFPLPVRMKVEGTTNPEVLVSINDVTVTEGTPRRPISS